MPSVFGYRVAGFVGSAAIALTGLAAGALPSSWFPIADWRQYAKPAILFAYLGMGLLCLAWWLLGRTLNREDKPDQRSLLITFAVWALPLAVAPPLFSRDVYSYLAQGTMVLANIDVYQFGVSTLGSEISAEVPDVWQNTPAPYGPAFLGIAALVVGAVEADIIFGLFAMRLVALLGLVLLLAYLPALARHCGVDPAAAMWLGALNPLVMLHLVAGSHNEALMMGLLIAGLTAAFDRKFVIATVLVTVAALIKAPAVVGLLVVASLWRPHLPKPDVEGPLLMDSRMRNIGRLSAGLHVGAIAALTTVVVTAITGTGYGWITSLGNSNSTVSATSWSITSALGRFFRFAFGSEAAMGFWLWAGMLAALVIIAIVWRKRRRLGYVYALGLSLAAIGLLGPATRPWYALWGLVPIAAAAPQGLVRKWAALITFVLAFLVLPNGFGVGALLINDGTL